MPSFEQKKDRSDRTVRSRDNRKKRFYTFVTRISQLGSDRFVRNTTNTVQEGNLEILINEVNNEYVPKFKRSGNRIHGLLKEAKSRLNEIKNLKFNEINAQIKALEDPNQLDEMLDHLQTSFNEFEFDIAEDENRRGSLSLNEEEEFDNIMEERKELLSRLEVIIANAK